MHRPISSLVIFLSIGFSLSVCRAQSCNTAASVTSDIWNKFTTEIADMGCSTVEAFTWEEMPECISSAEYIGLTNRLIQYWNNRSKNAWSTIGPRKMEYNRNYSGKLLGTSGRLFITPYPSDRDKVTITIQEEKGKAKTGILFCLVNQDNQIVDAKMRWFNDNNARKAVENESRKVVFENARGHLIKVNLDAKSATNTFEYKLTIESTNTASNVSSRPSSSRKGSQGLTRPKN